MKIHKMTAWDAGQVLIRCYDELSEAQFDLAEAYYTDLANVLRACKLKIGSAFNKHGSHDFGLPGEEDLKEIT